MGHRFEVDRSTRITRLTYLDVVTEEELRRVRERTGALVEAYPPSSTIIDFSQSTEVRVSLPMIREVARLPRSVPDNITVVIVAKRDLDYGFARMFQILNGNPKVHVVHELQEAYTVLGLAQPNFEPLELPE